MDHLLQTTISYAVICDNISYLYGPQYLILIPIIHEDYLIEDLSNFGIFVVESFSHTCDVTAATCMLVQCKYD